MLGNGGGYTFSKRGDHTSIGVIVFGHGCCIYPSWKKIKNIYIEKTPHQYWSSCVLKWVWGYTQLWNIYIYLKKHLSSIGVVVFGNGCKLYPCWKKKPILKKNAPHYYWYSCVWKWVWALPILKAILLLWKKKMTHEKVYCLHIQFFILKGHVWLWETKEFIECTRDLGECQHI
jgi:hypothetical protein